jgi:hypothetical protein
VRKGTGRLGWGTWHALKGQSYATETRETQFRDLFEIQRMEVKEAHGHGSYSRAEGMTRRAARRIARNRARMALREMRQSKQEAAATA